ERGSPPDGGGVCGCWPQPGEEPPGWDGGGGGALAALFPPVPPERDWASCMICAMASGLERMLFSLSSNSATAGPPPFCTCRYRPFMVLLMRSIKAAPSGLCISWFTMRTISAGLPLAADWAARWRDAPRS
ncbi:30S ribosome-binding factor RbfA, partial [Dysosmobacter welbionis]